ncbi:MAG: M28 family peptidase [Bacteroidota bacterium]
MKQFIIIIGFVMCQLSANAQNIACQKAIDAIRVDSLTNLLLSLTGRKPVVVENQTTLITSRNAYHKDNAIATDYLYEQCAQLGYQVMHNPFGTDGNNVIAYKLGTRTTKEVYMLCAHYDCVGTKNKPFQGADDNASGSAALLEAARVLKNYQFPFTVAFAFWDEEEEGLLGSAAFSPWGPLDWFIQGVINLDMIAYDGNNDSLANIHVYPTKTSLTFGQQVLSCNTLYPIGLNPVIINPGTRASDHFSFSVKNVTAIGLTEDYGPDFNPNWHMLSDSIENCHIPYFYKMTQLATAALCHISADGANIAVTEIKPPVISVYPNPAAGQINIEGIQIPYQISISDALGKQVLQTTVQDTKPLSLSDDINNGIYFITIIQNNNTHQQKITIIK